MDSRRGGDEGHRYRVPRAFVTARSDVVYGMSPDRTEMRFLDGRGFIPDAAIAEYSASQAGDREEPPRSRGLGPRRVKGARWLISLVYIATAIIKFGVT